MISPDTTPARMSAPTASILGRAVGFCLRRFFFRLAIGITSSLWFYYRRLFVHNQLTICTKISPYNYAICALEIVPKIMYHKCMRGGGTMPLQYKTDVLKALRNAGYTTYRIRQDGLLSQSTLQKLREGIGVSWDNIETVSYTHLTLPTN